MKDRPMPNIVARMMYRMHSPRNLTDELRVIRSGMISKGDRILDLGCGPGHLTVEMARAAGETGMVYGLDIHPLSIESLQKLAIEENVQNIQTILTDVFETGLDDQSLDLVFIFNAIHMIQDKERMAREVKRILKTGGRVIIRIKMRSREQEKQMREWLDVSSFALDGIEDKTTIFRKL